MPSQYTKIVVCANCGTQHKLTITNGIYPSANARNRNLFRVWLPNLKG